jgi:hypothetical protein
MKVRIIVLDYIDNDTEDEVNTFPRNLLASCSTHRHENLKSYTGQSEFRLKQVLVYSKKQIYRILS